MTAVSTKIEEFIFLIDAPGVAPSCFHGRFIKHLHEISQEARIHRAPEGDKHLCLWLWFRETQDTSGLRKTSFLMRRILEPSWACYDYRYDVGIADGQLEKLEVYTECEVKAQGVIRWLESTHEMDPTVSMARFSVSRVS